MANLKSTMRIYDDKGNLLHQKELDLQSGGVVAKTAVPTIGDAIEHAGPAVLAGAVAVIQSAPLAVFIVQKCTEAHLANLLELREIARGTEAEAYSWPRLMRRLDEMIAETQSQKELK